MDPSPKGLYQRTQAAHAFPAVPATTTFAELIPFLVSHANDWASKNQAFEDEYLPFDVASVMLVMESSKASGEGLKVQYDSRPSTSIPSHQRTVSELPAKSGAVTLWMLRSEGSEKALRSMKEMAIGNTPTVSRGRAAAHGGAWRPQQPTFGGRPPSKPPAKAPAAASNDTEHNDADGAREGLGKLPRKVSAWDMYLAGYRLGGSGADRDVDSMASSSAATAFASSQEKARAKEFLDELKMRCVLNAEGRRREQPCVRRKAAAGGDEPHKGEQGGKDEEADVEGEESDEAAGQGGAESSGAGAGPSATELYPHLLQLVSKASTSPRCCDRFTNPAKPADEYAVSAILQALVGLSIAVQKHDHCCPYEKDWYKFLPTPFCPEKAMLQQGSEAARSMTGKVIAMNTAASGWRIGVIESRALYHAADQVPDANFRVRIMWWRRLSSTKPIASELLRMELDSRSYGLVDDGWVVLENFHTRVPPSCLIRADEQLATRKMLSESGLPTAGLDQPKDSIVFKGYQGLLDILKEATNSSHKPKPKRPVHTLDRQDDEAPDDSTPLEGQIVVLYYAIWGGWFRGTIEKIDLDCYELAVSAAHTTVRAAD